ncbi:hypothetical protein GLOTRDRAFT_133793 [Gloeophyllum trabeum ATCC 11539]|uniref:Uncharacterized protein n=1 Tax=Gloeophyllum trabeum (strain ATCC 11539 / FP-39264 / Madison 617) TaxID=670483 RepID=S7R8P4_GLOTA|nr:uncharacterized protein GLOTRDRAFT_133793 [Gloeophyllum trabeum ATCC 11539]EPQ50690.1 hypothetical protein GLOTRDRAFT_133793 [Gloeophyllum trabeum ATCC 11539]
MLLVASTFPRGHDETYQQGIGGYSRENGHEDIWRRLAGFGGMVLVAVAMLRVMVRVETRGIRKIVKCSRRSGAAVKACAPLIYAFCVTLPDSRVEDATAPSVHRRNSPVEITDAELQKGNANEVEEEQVFVQDGQPIYFYLHRLTAAQKRYWLDLDPEVVDVGFVDVCIRRGKYAHAPPVRKGMSGPRPGQGKVEFLDPDKVNLARYLAQAIPDQESGGRQARVIYERLMEREEEGEGEEEEAVEKQVEQRPRNKDEERESMRPPPAKRMRRASESVTSRASEVEEEEEEEEVHMDDNDMFNPTGYYDSAEDLPLAGPSGTQRSPVPGASMSSQATLVGLVLPQLLDSKAVAPYRLQSVATSPSLECEYSQAQGLPDEAEESSGGSPADEDVPPPELTEEDVDVVPRQREKTLSRKKKSLLLYPLLDLRPGAQSPPPSKRNTRGGKDKEAGTGGGPATRSRQAELVDIQDASSDEYMIPLEEEGSSEVCGVPQAGGSARSRGSIGETQEEEEVEKAVDALSAATAESGASSVWKRLLHEDRKDYQPGQRRSVNKHPLDSDDQETIRDLAAPRGGRADAKLADDLEQLLSPIGSAQSVRRAASTSSWAATESGEGSRNFPPPGTRARVANEVLERAPYRPPRGTKAKEYANRV